MAIAAATSTASINSLKCLVIRPRCHSHARYCVDNRCHSVSSTHSVGVGDAISSSQQPPLQPHQYQQQQHHEQRLLHIDKHHVLHPYTSMTSPIPTHLIHSARGIHLQLHDGKVVIDGMSSWWAAMHGYRHPHLDDALQTQAIEYMSHVMFGGLTHRPAVELAARLLRLVNGEDEGDQHKPSNQQHQQQPTNSRHDNITDSKDDDDDFLNSLSSQDLDNMQNQYQLTKVFFADSGSISIEVAMKMAMQYWSSSQSGTEKQQHSQKNKFLALRGGYHGDTLGAMSICDPDNGMRDTHFGEGAVRQQYFVPNPTGPREEDAHSTLLGLEGRWRTRQWESSPVRTPREGMWCRPS